MQGTAPTSPTKHTLCNDLSSFMHAARVLDQSPVFIIDCEGRNLGGPDGVLSLICIGTERAEHVFLLDALALKPLVSRLPLLFELLQDPSKKKLMWDCRNDAFEILSDYGIMLQGVVDLQLAEVLSRSTMRKETDWHRAGRLKRPHLPIPVIKKNPKLFAGVHSLQGMDSCIRETRLTTSGKDRE